MIKRELRLKSISQCYNLIQDLPSYRGVEIDRDLNAAKVLASKAVGYTVLACGMGAADSP